MFFGCCDVNIMRYTVVFVCYHIAHKDPCQSDFHVAYSVTEKLLLFRNSCDRRLTLLNWFCYRLVSCVGGSKQI